MKKIITVFVVVIMASLIFVNRAHSETLSAPMPTFSSDKEFDSYLVKAKKVWEEENKKRASMPQVLPAVAPSTAADKSGAAKTDSMVSESESENITNVQESGVDEGDIVKKYNDYLVVLRRGKLFSVDLKKLKTVSAINAFPKDFTSGTWYDEMLIYKNKIMVIGYTYELRATQIGIFDISDNGILKHNSTYFVDSNDYYSSRNYASRLIGNKLVFYMPYNLFLGKMETGRSLFPHLRKWESHNEVSDVASILKKTDIYKPIQNVYNPYLHIVSICDLDSPDLKCSAKAVVGAYSRNFYVSPSSVYVWVSPETKYWDKNSGKGPSYVYKIGLKDAAARSLKGYGTPVDQFSFKEEDGYLNVMLRDDGYGEGMFGAEFSSGNVSLLRTSLDNFRDSPPLIAKGYYRKLIKPDGYYMQNRFAGDYLFYGTGDNWVRDNEADEKVYYINFKKDQKASELELEHSVSRIEPIDGGVVVIGSSRKDLLFTSIDISGKPKIIDTFEQKGAVEGETRSHGFFFKNYPSDGYGLLGLPLRKKGQGYQQLYKDSEEVKFLKVVNKKFFDAGALSSRDKEIDDKCKQSCVDWYGNSRPIFIGKKIYAMMGYELIEGSFKNEKISEKARLNFFK